jgi:hypothetical protein
LAKFRAPVRRTLSMLMALGATAALATDFKGDAHVWAGTGIDSNPRRDFTSQGIGTPPDAFAAAVVTGSGLLQNDWGRLSGSYDFGGRKFLLYPSEDTLVQALTLDGTAALGEYFELGVLGRLRDRRGADRDYTDLSAEAALSFVPDAAVDVRAHVAAHRFLYWNRFSTSFWGPQFGLSASYRFTKRHSVFISADFEPRRFNADAYFKRDDEGEPPPPPTQRRDSFFSVGLGYSYRGPFMLTAQYAYLDSSSNSFGETYRRHRFSGTAGLRLPLNFTLLVSGAVQFAQYPDGVFLSSDLIVLEDDENSNSLSIKLVHPLGEHFDLDFKYAVYFNRLLRNDLTYLRMVGSVGIGWRF